MAKRGMARHSRPTAAFRLLGMAVAAGVVLAAIAFPLVGGLGLAARQSANTFSNLPTELVADGRPPERSVIEASDGQRIANLYLQNRVAVPLSAIAPVARSAVIAIEDSRFYSHRAIDVRGTLRALLTDSQSGGATQGGSTLTQQYVKNVLLYSATTKSAQEAATADTLGRKLKEARIAVALEHKLTKNQILARYLNIAYFGSGAYGIETAARIYFGISAAKLDLPQAALLAGLVQSPSGYDPHDHMDKAIARRNTVLMRMQQLGYITQAERASASSTPIKLAVKPPAPSNGCTQALLTDSGFFCDYVRNYLTDELHLTQAQLYAGGLTIKTTLDPEMQQKVMASLTSMVPKDNPNAAVLDIVQPGTGNVLAMGVNRTYGASATDPRQTTINLGTKPVSLAGSTYKTFTLAAALEKKVPYNYTIDATTPYHSSLFDATFHNDSPSEQGQFNLKRATVQSVNTYFIKLLESDYFRGDLTGPVRLAQKMGLAPRTLPNSLAEATIQNRRASFTLGAVPSSPLDMADAFATIAANGKHCAPDPILSITKPDGSQLALPRKTCDQALPKKIAVGVTGILQGDPSTKEPEVSYNTASVAALDDQHPAAGKTGTTNDNSGLWFVGYTPHLSGAVAVFNPETPSRMVRGIPAEPAPVSSSFAAKIWHAAVAPIVSGTPGWTWPTPAPSVVHGNAVRVPCVVDYDTSSAEQSVIGAGFLPVTGGSRYSIGIPYGYVAAQNPDCGAYAGKGATVTLTTSLGGSPVPTTNPPPVIVTQPPTAQPPAPPPPPSSRPAPPPTTSRAAPTTSQPPPPPPTTSRPAPSSQPPPPPSRTVLPTPSHGPPSSNPHPGSSPPQSPTRQGPPSATSSPAH